MLTAPSSIPDVASQTVEQLVAGLDGLPEKVKTAIRNNGGGHYNHTLFWSMMSKTGGGAPQGELAKAIDDQFKTFSAFKEEFIQASLGRFGSGWAWLTLDTSRQLRVESTANQDNPLTQRRVPLLGLDVWEHAYYLKYQNRRPEYVAAFFSVINWDYVAERFQNARA